MYSLKNIIALMGGLLFLSQCVSGAAVYPRAYGTLTCAEVSAFGFPLKKDCEAALAKVPPGNPEVCTQQFQPEMDYITVESCTIHTYSDRGMAHCLNRDMIRKGGKKILTSCTFETQCCPSEVYTGGQYEWFTQGKKEGFKFVKAPVERW
ncbi:hypothetical protein L211DRAFT_834321 [Terfezia boudieri ATCC MYA-4762]|uniref:Lipoprotein n=1 Tax=Terfezia boudieri ATCC MYA-4762 TaxID=1051890 RepID=A0A3N4LXE1_9PEZI|nr:hypothetical protein L211DRAFT_834321 [Terfezia boudieri ATCC MYA-4762]